MSTSFPTGKDTLVNPTSNDTLASVSHSGQHTNANDAIEALEDKVGITNSSDTASLDYKVSNTSSSDPGHKHTSSSLTLTADENFVTAAQATVIGNTSGTNTGDDKTSITGLLKGDGSDISAAVEDTDYQGVLSEGAFADGDKTKLDGIETGAEVNNISDANATNLVNHLSNTSNPHTTTLALAATAGATTSTDLTVGDVLKVGDGTTGTDKQVLANNGDANLPALKYNETDNKWQYSNDGSSFSDIGSGSGGSSPLTTKGDIYTYSTTDTRLPVGTNGQVLSADSTESTGLKWIDSSGVGTVTSVDMTVPTGLSISGNPITSSGTLALTYDTGYQAYTTTEASKLSGIEAGAEVNTVDSVNTQTGAVVLDADDIDDTSTTNKFVTATDITNLSNLSGTNTGDQTLPTRDSLGLDTDDTVTFANLSGSNTGDQDLSSLVPKSLYDANTILYATTDNTPAALTVAEQKVIGRVTGGAISTLSIDSDLTPGFTGDISVPSSKAAKAYADTKITNVVEDTSPQLGGDLDLNGHGLSVPSLTSAITDVLDEDDMSSDSATKLATQQSIKAYVDANAGGSGVGSIYRQALFNPACEIYQLAAAVTLTSGKLFGGPDGFYAKGEGTAVSAGTITQATSANCGVSGYADKLSGVTLTGTGKVHAYRFIESLNAKLYKNQAASFGVKVYHDVGSAINFVVKINKADSSDNFSAVTNIATASAQSVPNTTETRIVFENINSGDLGDCSNGIEIEIEADCGAITTKNFEFAEWQFNLGSTVLDFCCGDYEREFNICTVHFERHYIGASKLTPLQSLCNIDSGNRGEVYLHWSRKRKAPTVTLKTYANWIWSNITTGANVALSQQLQFYLGKDIYGGNAFASCSSLSTNTVVELTTSTAGEYIDYDARVTIA